MNRTKKSLKVALVFALAIVMLANVCMPIAVKGSNRDISTEYQYYSVKRGDTLTKIAKNNGITISDIMTANNLSDADRIYTGQVLKVPLSSASGKGNALAASRISMRLVNANVKDVLSAIALNAGYTIIMEKSAMNDETVTVTLEEMSALKAIDYVTRLVGLTYLKDGNTIMIGTADALNSTFVDKTVLSKISLNYISAESLQSQMSSLGLSNVQMVSTNNKNEFYVSGYPKELAKVSELVKLLDVSSNIMAGGGLIPSNFTALELTHIAADEFNNLLGSLGLSQGIVLASRPYTLYVYVTGANLADIKTIQKIVDQPLSGANLDALKGEGNGNGSAATPDSGNTTPAPDATKPAPQPSEPSQPQPVEPTPTTPTNAVLKPIKLNFIDRTEAENILASFPLEIKTYGPKKATRMIWISGTEAQVAEAEARIQQFDTEEYASSVLNDKTFFAYELQNCTAAEMLDRLQNLTLEGVTICPNGDPAASKSLMIYCAPYLEDATRKLLAEMDVAASAVAPSNRAVEANSSAATAEKRIAALKELYPEISQYTFIVKEIPDKGGQSRYITYVTATAESANYIKALFAEMDSAA